MKILPLKVRIDKDRYSESSKRSCGHEALGEFYSDYSYVCVKCSRNATYLAIEQKKAYENRKEYMWAKPKLCSSCWQEMRRLKVLAQNLESQYCSNKGECLNDREFLESWLDVLKQHSAYAVYRSNKSRIKFLEKHLEQL
jgi:DNA-directed RNA polymerase subunit RPC12/RpoP